MQKVAVAFFAAVFFSAAYLPELGLVERVVAYALAYLTLIMATVCEEMRKRATGRGRYP